MLFDLRGQELCVGGALRVTSIVQLGFAGNASDHHRLHVHKSRPSIANDIDPMSEMRASTRQNVLIEDERRLDGANASVSVLQCKIQVSKLGMDRIVQQIIVAMIFVL
jgi:hypothetical protein